MIMRIGLYAAIGLMFVVLGGNGRQMPSKPPEPIADVQDAGQMHMWHQRWLAMKHKARLASRSQKPKAKWMHGWIATHYAQSGTTADGETTKARWTVAVDPRYIPLGSLVEVKLANGQTQIYKAEDTGRLVKGRHIDIFNPSVSECLKLGKQMVSVRVLKEAK